MESLLEIENLNFQINNQDILKDINLEIFSGEIVGLFGNNGVGKTTLLKFINNEHFGYTGKIKIKNKIIDFDDNPKEIIYLSSDKFFSKNLTIKDNINILKQVYKIDEETVIKQSLELKIKMDMKINELSKGNLEFLKIIIFCASDAELIILDEAFSGLDFINKEMLLKLIIDANCNGKTFIITTHHIEEVENIISRLVFISDKSIIIDKDLNEEDIVNTKNYINEKIKEEYENKLKKEYEKKLGDDNEKFI